MSFVPLYSLKLTADFLFYCIITCTHFSINVLTSHLLTHTPPCVPHSPRSSLFSFSSCAFSHPSEHNHLNNVTLPPLSPGMTLSQPHNNLGFNKYSSLKTMGKTYAQPAVTSCNARLKRHTCSSRSLYPQPLITIANHTQCHWLQGKHSVITYANITSQIKREKTLTCY